MAKKTNILEHLNKIISKNNLARRLDELPYPFLRPLAWYRSSKWKHEIRVVDLLAQDSFEVGDSLKSILKLEKWQKTSPKSWLVCEHKGIICGYVHVEPLKKDMGDSIRRSEAHEGMIESKHIPRASRLKNGDYIHIGSIVSKPLENMEERTEVALRLLAGIVDRVLDLSPPKANAAHHILAVDYPDINNKRHATNILRLYGFEHRNGEVTSEELPNEVYFLDIHQPYSSKLRKLVQAVLTRREKHKIWKKKVLKKFYLLYF